MKQETSRSELRIERLAEPGDAWERFVEASPDATFSHLGGWHAIMRDVFRHEPIYLASRDTTGVYRGVLPLVRVRSMLGHYLLSMPFLNDGGPLGEPAAVRQLVEHAVEDARRSGAKLLELRSRHDLPGPVTSSNRKITVHLPLPDSIAELWEKTFRAKLRSQIRRPMKEGMTARCGPAELDAFYHVFTRNMHDLGTPVLPRSFFERIASTFGDRVIFSAVYLANGAPAAAACSLQWRDEVEIVWASSLREYNTLSPNMLLYARTIEASIVRGARVFNFGRCTRESPTHKFKQQWGGHDVELPWPTWSRSGPVAPPSPDRPIFQVATSVWRRLPLAVTNRLGPVLSRHLP